MDQKKQRTPLLRAGCPHCGDVMRITRRRAENDPPVCPEHGPMVIEWTGRTMRTAEERRLKRGDFAPQLRHTLRKLRKDRGLGLRDAAHLIGLSDCQLSNLENGVTKNPTLRALTLIGQFYGMTVGQLIGETP